MKNNVDLEKLEKSIKKIGINNVSIIDAALIPTDVSFRKMCEMNTCGVFGKCWTCPPDVGDINELMARIGDYKSALVFQYIGQLEDSFDFEGMIDSKKKFYKLTACVREAVADAGVEDTLLLGAGGCGVCERCAKRDEEPCRFPDLAIPSLEAYGVNVSGLAKASGLKYINGANTVTYFGAVLFN